MRAIKITPSIRSPELQSRQKSIESVLLLSFANGSNCMMHVAMLVIRSDVKNHILPGNSRLLHKNILAFTYIPHTSSQVTMLLRQKLSSVTSFPLNYHQLLCKLFVSTGLRSLFNNVFIYLSAYLVLYRIFFVQSMRINTAMYMIKSSYCWLMLILQCMVLLTLDC